MSCLTLALSGCSICELCARDFHLPPGPRTPEPNLLPLLPSSLNRIPVCAEMSGDNVSTLRQRRIVARIDRVGEEFLFRPGPELADVLVGVDCLVPELEPVFGALLSQAPDIDVADHVVEMIELERPARGVDETDRFKRRHELFSVAGVGAGGLQARVEHLAIAVEQRRILTGNGVVILQHAVDEALIGLAFAVERVRRGADQSDRFVAKTLE